MNIERLKNRRLQLNMTQADLAEKMGLSEAAIGLYEQGKREPSHEKLVKLADILSSSTDYLLGKEDSGNVYREGFKILGLNSLSKEQFDELMEFFKEPNAAKYLSASKEALESGVPADSL